jgi:hypothetical protein
VSAGYDVLEELFECVENFLKRVHIYSGVSLNPFMVDTIVKIMVELLSVFALATTQLNQGRLSK